MNSRQRSVGSGHESNEDPTFVGLRDLLRAHRYAIDTGSNIWDFAVEITHLRALGLTDSDLRWLVRKGYVEHAREVTVQGRDGREFQSTGDLTFRKRTCFVLTEEAVANARSFTGNQATSANYGELSSEGIHSESNGQAVPNSIPYWDAETRVLNLSGDIVKQFKWQAANQELVLSAFQEDGWPARIDDPLPPQLGQDSKRRLSDTIKCLNRKQKNELIHFRGDGTGEGVNWELVEQNGSDALSD